MSLFGIFWSAFSPIRTEYGPEKLRIRALHAVSGESVNISLASEKRYSTDSCLFQ